MPFVDTHCHLDDILKRLDIPSFGEFRARYLTPDCEALLTVACDPDSFDPVGALLGEPGIFAAYGVHPNEASRFSPEVEERLSARHRDPKVVAFGEIGLDFHYGAKEAELQQRVFARQLEMGKKLGKPLVIHTREADEPTFSLLQSHLPADYPMHVHCFTGAWPFAERLLHHFPRLFIGLTGIVTFKNAAAVQEVARRLPLSRLLLETDGPYLAPAPHRGQVAHPGHIPLIAQKIAELRGIDAAEVFAATRENTRALYGI